MNNNDLNLKPTIFVHANGIVYLLDDNNKVKENALKFLLEFEKIKKENEFSLIFFDNSNSKIIHEFLEQYKPDAIINYEEDFKKFCAENSYIIGVSDTEMYYKYWAIKLNNHPDFTCVIGAENNDILPKHKVNYLTPEQEINNTDEHLYTSSIHQNALCEAIEDFLYRIEKPLSILIKEKEINKYYEKRR
ncbi:hypothetical protein [Mycoplasmopsis opalescens]|uniref:hypothetical protein n=1 Tax=Mycoplasmopsis opalescens TaxID=114886 RepID=UPI0004A6F86B|nr:hypothetical protein [Mycoplasmopsis opalescens]